MKNRRVTFIAVVLLSGFQAQRTRLPKWRGDLREGAKVTFDIVSNRGKERPAFPIGAEGA